jgi:hypothetical protein
MSQKRTNSAALKLMGCGNTGETAEIRMGWLKCQGGFPVET